jgi:hypothetical protein
MTCVDGVRAAGARSGPPAPAGSRHRIAVLDVARGVAVLGTPATSIWIFIDPAGIVGYLDGLPSLDQPVQTVARQLATQARRQAHADLRDGPGAAASVGAAARPAVARPPLAGGAAVPGRVAALPARGGVRHPDELRRARCCRGRGAGHVAAQPADLAVDGGEHPPAADVRVAGSASWI